MPEQPVFEVMIRDLDDTARVLSDNRGGWRLERYFSQHQYLEAVEDNFGLLVQVVRGVDGRPVGIQLAQRYALEYFYSGPGGQCQRRVLYEPRSGKVIAHTVDALQKAIQYEPESLRETPSTEPESVVTVTARGRSYAILSAAEGAPVIRSIDIDDPTTGAILDRVDYTDSHLIVQFGSDVEGRPRVFTIPRHTRKPSQPVIIELREPRVARYDAVWSLADRGKFSAVPVPNLRGGLPTAVEDTLREAFNLALERVRRVPTCRSLFEEFITSGNQRLTATLYSPPAGARTSDSCKKGALAYTHVGSSITHLCTGFGGLSLEQAAIVLIHEALHFAGMEEAPFYEGALTSKEINELVRDNCGF